MIDQNQLLQSNKILFFMNKNDYLSYFNQVKPQQPIKQSLQLKIQRPKSSQYHIVKDAKLLPHIIEQYQYRITNQLLEQKISNPRRDKIIVKSNAKKKKQSISKNKQIDIQSSLEKENNQNLNIGMSIRRKKTQIEMAYKTFEETNSPINNCKNDLISLENKRMGKRLINTRSMVQDILTKTYYTYQIYNGKIVNRDKFIKINRKSVKFRNCNQSVGKINNGIKNFFQNNVKQQKKDSFRYSHTINSSGHRSIKHSCYHTQQKQQQELSAENEIVFHGLETSNPCMLQVYGKGQLNFIINKLIIKSNPLLKPESILILQVIQKQNSLTKILNDDFSSKNNFMKSICQIGNNNKDQQNCYTTASFPYQYISQCNLNQFGIKFKIQYRKFVYLRLLKAEGINHRELGVFKIEFQTFRTKQKGQFPFKISKQVQLIDGVQKYRDIFTSQCQGNLFKLNKGVISTKIFLEYQLFQNRFIPSRVRTQPQCRSQDI